MKSVVLPVLLLMTVHASPDAPDDAELAMRSAALTPQSGESPDIRSLFNENADRVRLMVLLSPT